MGLPCTRCEGTGFINLHQIDDDAFENLNRGDFQANVLKWIGGNESHDVQVCDCCGDGKTWHGTPGEHNNYGKRAVGQAEPFPSCY